MYIGNDLQVAFPSYRNIDNISGSFNGVTTSFALLINGSAPVPPPLSSNQCLISINGVIQKPDDTGASGFRLSGGNIVFSSAPAGGATFFGVVLAGADYVNAGVNFPDGSVGAPSITFDQDNDTGYYRSASGAISFSSNGVASGTWNASGITAPALSPTGSTVPTNGVYLPSANNVAISTNGSGRLFIDSSGKVLAVTSTARALQYATPTLQVEGTGYTQAHAQIWGNSNDIFGGFLTLGKSRGTGWTVVQNNDILGAIDFAGADGTDDVPAGTIRCEVDGTPGANDMPSRIVISTTSDGSATPTERMRINSLGNVGIGKSPSIRLDVATPNGSGSVLGATNVSARFTDNTNSTFAIGHPSGGGVDLIGNLGLNLCTSDGTTKSERARIDSSGRLLVGTSSGPAGATVVFSGNAFDGSTGDGRLHLNRGSTPSSGAQLGAVYFSSNNGANEGASILAVRDGGTWTAGSSHPSRLVFSTTADGASSPTERMRITSDGDVFINKTGFSSSTAGIELQKAGAVYATRSGSVCGLWNRLASDGDIILIQQDSVTEGSISVSGTTVSYNGAHLSRWSQLPGGTERTEILRGTVLSNIDEMCGWGDEENEQLNRMKVSDVEGDPNVAGVFQAWDDDDDTYTDDFYCAMTGDFIIRIAEGVTVQRGELLMSAGDGTAKPQDDDIIRSKTVAKVTSTHITCTYDDGSYCVPCVLMAC